MGPLSCLVVEAKLLVVLLVGLRAVMLLIGLELAVRLWDT